MAYAKKNTRKSASVQIAEELSNEIAREFWVAQHWDENPSLSYQDALSAWSGDIDRVRQWRKSIRLGLFRLAERSIMAVNSSKPAPVAADTVAEIARELWMAQHGVENPSMSRDNVLIAWRTNTYRVRKIRDITGLTLARLAKRGIGFSA